jgi:hypothetical protein
MIRGCDRCNFAQTPAALRAWGTPPEARVAALGLQGRESATTP